MGSPLPPTKKTPTPPEWSLWTKFYFREAKEKQFPHQLAGLEIPNWTYVATSIKKAIDRLEDPDGDGAGIQSALGEGEGAIQIAVYGRRYPTPARPDQCLGMEDLTLYYGRAQAL